MQLTPTNAKAFRLTDVDREFILDPYPQYRVLRDHAPICLQSDGSYVISRFSDVKFALSDSHLFSSDKRVDFKPKFGESPLYEHHTTSIRV